MSKQLSIIVPVYNVEKYIFKCIDSIYHQGIEDSFFDIIIVNDGTKDTSMEIVSTFAHQHSNIVIINQENQGLSMARNNGLAHANGDYILFVDSDDFLVENSLPTLLSKMRESSADMLIADYRKMTDEEIGRVTPVYDNTSYKTTIMNGMETFLDFFVPNQCYVWRSIYSRKFLEKNHIIFISNLYFEDIPFTTECYLKVEKTISFPMPFYVYRQHNSSIVSSINKKKLLDFNLIIEYLWRLLYSEKLDKNVHNKMIDTIFSTFSIEMWYLSHDKRVIPHRAIIIEDLKKKVPNLFFKNSLKQIIISLLYKCVPYLYLRIRSLFK